MEQAQQKGTACTRYCEKQEPWNPSGDKKGKISCKQVDGQESYELEKNICIYGDFQQTDCQDHLRDKFGNEYNFVRWPSTVDGMFGSLGLCVRLLGEPEQFGKYVC